MKVVVFIICSIRTIFTVHYSNSITYLFSNNHFLEVLAGRANKSTVSYISIKQISQKKITIPPLPLQHLFAQRIEQIERQKSAVQKSITDLETLLASRMQYWFE